MIPKVSVSVIGFVQVGVLRSIRLLAKELHHKDDFLGFLYVGSKIVHICAGFSPAITVGYYNKMYCRQLSLCLIFLLHDKYVLIVLD